MHLRRTGSWVCCCQMLLCPWHCRTEVTAAGVAAAAGGWPGRMNSSGSAVGLHLNLSSKVYRLHMCSRRKMGPKHTRQMFSVTVTCTLVKSTCSIKHAGVRNWVVRSMHCCAGLARWLPTKRCELHMPLNCEQPTSAIEFKQVQHN
jgi:hypothetical protein